MKKRVAIFASGGGSNFEALAVSIDQDHSGEVAVLVTNAPEAGVIAKATARGIPTLILDHRPFASREAFEDVLADKLEAFTPDVICLAGFMRVLTAGFVARYEGRMLNIHPSLLPKYRGLNTHQRALEAGETEHGCTVHIATPELDDGPILGQARVPVLPGDDAQSLAARVLVQEHILYPAVLKRFLDGDQTPLFLS